MEVDNKTDRLRFSIILVHRNGYERLLHALNSIHSAVDSTHDEVIVVDNHSTDDSLDRATNHYPDVKVVRNSCNAGYAKACNQGIYLARGQYILVCNNDLIFPENILEQFEADFEDYPEAAMFAGQLLKEDGTLSRSAGPISTFLTEMGWKSRRRLTFSGEMPVKVGSVIGACMAVRRSAIDQAGVLDEEFFFYYEELEWCVRIGRRGWAIMIDPRIRIIHSGGASTKSYFYGARIEFFRSRLTYWKKTMPKSSMSILLAWHSSRLLLDSLLYLAGAVCTLGMSSRLRYKLKDKSVVLVWLLLGCPESWGLPDKCAHMASQQQHQKGQNWSKT